MIPQDTGATRNRFLPGTAIPHPARCASRRRRSAQPSHFLRSLLAARADRVAGPTAGRLAHAPLRLSSAGCSAMKRRISPLFSRIVSHSSA